MRNLVKASLYRLIKSTGARVALGVSAAAAIAYYILAAMISAGRIPAEQAGSVTGLADAMVIWLLGSLAAGLLVGADLENRTVHGAIHYGRKRILLHYFVVFAVAVFLLLLPYTIGSLVCVAAGVDFSGAQAAAVSVYLDNVLRFQGGGSIGKLLLTYLSCAVVYIGQLSICLPVAIKLKKPVAVTAFGFFFGMITASIAALASQVEMLDNLYKLTPYAYTLSKINLQADVSALLAGILVSVIFTGVMGLISGWIFRRSDLK